MHGGMNRDLEHSGVAALTYKFGESASPVVVGRGELALQELDHVVETSSGVLDALGDGWGCGGGGGGAEVIVGGGVVEAVEEFGGAIAAVVGTVGRVEIERWENVVVLSGVFVHGVLLG